MKSIYAKIALLVGLPLGVFAGEDCYEESYFYDYDNRVGFFVPRLEYERIKVDAVYAGIDGWIVPVISSGRGKKHAGRWLGEAELRLGYNYFFRERNHVTPFFGGGVIKESRISRHDHLPPAVAYGAFGFLYMHEFSPFFNFGLNFKGMIGRSVDKKDRWNWGSPVGGIDVGLPITFKLGSKKRWDICLEPFDIYLRGSHLSRNYFGGRGTIGYRF